MRNALPFAALAFLALPACGHGGGHGGIDGYVSSLPAWPAPSPDARVAGDQETDWVTGSDGRSYRCTITPYSLTATPDKVTTFDPNADVLWPGALLQGKPLQQGVLEGLPLTERAPLDVSIPDLLAANNTLRVEHPDLASVQQAVGSLVNASVQAGVHAASSVNFHKVEAYSASQSALDLGFSGDYIGFDLQASLGLQDSANLHSVVVSFVQKMFTVTIPEPETPGDFFQDLTGDEIQQQVDAGHLGTDNLPVYVSGVTYGRILMFSVVSHQSTAQIQAALNAQYNGLVGGGSVAASYAALLSDSSTSIHLVTVGGSASNAEAAIHDGNPNEYFATDPPISTGVPISYVIRYLRDNRIASVSETTNYDVKTCVETTSGPGASWYVGDVFNHTIKGYDESGHELALTAPVTLPSGQSAFAIAWDSVDDRILVAANAKPQGSSSAVQVYQPDGQFLYGFDGGGFAGPQSLFYDPKYDRVYVSTFNDVSAWSPEGHLQKSYANGKGTLGAVFDPDADMLYVLQGSQAQGFTITEMALDGTAAQLSPGAFSGMNHPIAIAFDPVTQHLFAASDGFYGGAYTPIVSIFDLAGNTVGTFDLADYPVGMTLKDGILYVATTGGFVLQYLPDGTFVQPANDTFVNLGSGGGIAFRP